MRTPLKLAAFAAGLAVVFAASLGAGRLTGPIGTAADPTARAGHGHDTTAATPDKDPGHDATGPGGHTDATGSANGTDSHGGGHDTGGATRVPGGLQVAEDGYRLEPLSGTLADGEPFRFRIVGPDGAPVTRYAVEHDKELHLIVVRRDLAGYRHVHPVRAADGTWSVPLPVTAAGQYRVIADFRPQDRAEGLILGVDVPAPGDYRPLPLPGPARTAQVDGYTVTLDGDPHATASSALGLSVRHNAVPVTDLEPYLGAMGHLVALRQGDLAYLHVHPDGGAGAGPRIGFTAEVPSAGTYRLYLDFKHGGVVRTAEFTVVVDH